MSARAAPAGGLARIAILVLVGVIVLKESLGQPEWLTAYELNVLLLLFGLVGFVSVELRGDDPSVPRLATLTVATTILIALMLRQGGRGIPSIRGGLEYVVLFVLFVTYPLLHADLRRVLRRNGVYLLAYATLLGVYLYHGSTHGADSGLGSFPIASGFVLVASLFVVPRYVGGRAFLWAVARVSAVVVLLGLGAYRSGDYTALFLPVRLWETSFSPPFLPVEVNTLQAIFGNPNTTAIVAFPGAFAALVETHRSLDHDGVRHRLLVPAGLLAVNGLGLYLTNSRAGMLAAAAAAGLFLAVSEFGREALPHALVAVVGVVTAALAALALDLVDVDPGGRIVLWRAGIDAIVATPTLVGEGIIEPGEIIEPFVRDPDHRGAGVHNSYLTTAIRAGLLGAAAHVALAVGSVVHATFGDRPVDVAMVALALGFAIHQLFESYTLFHHSMGASLAALTVGFVVFELGTVSSPGSSSSPHAGDADGTDWTDGTADGRAPSD